MIGNFNTERMMKRNYLIAGVVVIGLCGSLFYAHAETETDYAPKSVAAAETEVLNKDGKVLVAYFTSPETDGVDAVAGASRVIVNGDLYGNTEYVAKIISQATKGDLFAIKTVHSYPGTHKELIDAAKKEADSQSRPKLATHINNLSEYDVVFVGYPNWWYDMPMALYTFFDEYDFSGKTVIPFCTHGGSRFSKSVQTITDMEKGAKVIQGPSVSRNGVVDAEKSVKKWLENKGLLK